MLGKRFLLYPLLGLLFLAISYLTFHYLYLGRGEPEIYLLPDGFTGPVVMVFDWDEGKPIRYEDGKRVYDIPPDGVFVTNNRGNPGHLLSGDRQFFHVARNGSRSSISESPDWQSDLKRLRGSEAFENVTAFAFRYGTAVVTYKGATNWCFFVAFVIGRLEEWQSLVSRRDALSKTLFAK